MNHSASTRMPTRPSSIIGWGGIRVAGELGWRVSTSPHDLQPGSAAKNNRAHTPSAGDRQRYLANLLWHVDAGEQEIQMLEHVAKPLAEGHAKWGDGWGDGVALNFGEIVNGAVRMEPLSGALMEGGWLELYSVVGGASS